MKSLIALVCVVSLSAAAAVAGDGRISDNSLAKIGLSAMKPMTDAHGLQIRGMSAQAGGFSIATVGGATAVNAYYGNGGESARGGDVSVAVSNFHVVIAGGRSGAHN